MKRTGTSGVRREDLARALAERSRKSDGGGLTNGQARDELDRLVHGILTNLRQGRRAEMPGIGPLVAKGLVPIAAARIRSAPATRLPPGTSVRKSKP